MQTAYAEADLAKLAKLAHALSGSGGTVGFDCFTEPARRLELAAKQRQAEAIEDGIRELAALADQIIVPT